MSSTSTTKAAGAPGGRKKLLLAGNPNAGKTTVFNRLTGLRQRVGNYPGVTVERKSGHLSLGNFAVEVVDLPGTYSLAAASPDEHIAVEALTGKIPGEERPDAVLCVVDASNLQRHLFLVSQILSFELPVILALNMMDLAESRGWKIDVAGLSKRLGIPVVPLTATTGEGWNTLLQTIETTLAHPAPAPPLPLPEEVGRATDFVRSEAAKSTGTPVGRAEAERLLFDNTNVGAKGIGWEEPGRSECLEKAAAMLREAGWNPSSCEAVMRYRGLRTILQGVMEKTAAPEATWSHRLDAVLTHRVGGLLTFAGIMYCVFMAIYAWAGPLMDGIDSLFAWLGELVSPFFDSTPMLQSLVVDGVIAGVGGVVIFLPQILILFAFITILEDSGYMARAAFLMDRVFGWCGLNGRSFVPMLSSYACAIPGIMAARTISDPKARLLTILISPLMSCSARLPVYVLLIGAFIEPRYGAGWAAFCLFAMHLIGLAVAIPVAWIMNRFVLKIPTQAFVLEMPPYRRPVLSNIAFRLWEAGRAFCLRAGSIILAISVIIWALLYFPRPEAVEEKALAEFLETRAQETGTSLETLRSELETSEALEMEAQGAVDGAYLEQSIMARLGKAIQPLFAPAGFDWKITVGVLASFPAREVIVSTLGIIYRLGGEVDEEDPGLRSALAAERWHSGPLAGQPVFTPAVALAIMVFFALCMQCGATLAIMAKETTWAWAAFAFAYMTTLAWIGAVITYQIASRILVLPNG